MPARRRLTYSRWDCSDCALGLSRIALQSYSQSGAQNQLGKQYVMAKYQALAGHRDPFRPYSLLSQVTMWWARKYTVAPEQVTEAHVSSLPPPVDLDFYVEQLQLAWDKQLRAAHPSFFRALVTVFWRKYCLYMVPFVLKTVGQLAIAVAITILTESLADEHVSLEWRLELALFYSIASVLTICMVNQGFFRGQILATFLRATIFSVIYEKALSLSARTLTSPAVSARLTTLIASELDQIEYLNATWYVLIAPLFIVLGTPVVFWMIGWAGMAGVAAVLLFLPVKSYMSKFAARFYSASSVLTETRLKATQMLTENIRPVKMCACEDDLIAAIDSMRTVEFREHSNMNVNRNLTTAFFFSGGSLLTLIVLVVHVSLGNAIHAGRMFGALGILLTMNTWVTGIMSWGLDMVAWYKTLFATITEFMTLQEQKEERLLTAAGSNPSVVCEELFVSWGERQSGLTSANAVELAARDGQSPARAALQSVSLSINKGELVMIVGLVGSGKSSLLSALNGDLHITEGRISISSSVAYVTQEPWIVSGTVRENILLGETFEEEKYGQVVAMCGLLPDFEQMPQADRTVIGDSGSTLSGGQKARVALARAVYRRKDVYLLDDPLSAVDAQVGLHIFTECIQRGLRSATRLMVTHHHQFLPQADRVVVMHEGRVLLQGTYSELQGTEELNSVLSASANKGEGRKRATKQDSEERQINDDNEFCHVIEEEREAGSVPLRVYIEYLLLFFRSKWVLLALATLLALLQAVNLSATYWVSVWSVQSAEAQQDAFYVWVLVGIVALLLLLTVLRNVIVFGGLNRCNRELHHKALVAVAKTDLAFFDKNPSGRIMSRFTKDISLVENVLMKFFSDLLMLGSMLLSYAVALVVMSPLNLLTLLLFFPLAVKFGRKFVTPSRHLKRLELSTKADIVSLVNASVRGIATIHSLDLAPRFLAKFNRMRDVNFLSWFSFFVNLRSFQVLNDYLGILFLCFNAFFSVLFSGNLPASVLAVGFSFTVLVISYLGWFGDVYINVGNQMISVHRLCEYTRLPAEPDSFPAVPLRVTAGEIVFENVSLRYAAELDFALRSLSFTIPGGSKTGIVGRTGSGKSSLILALFRMKELAGGRILIDGQETQKVGLKSLRQHIAAIPQSPLLFRGDVRSNIDPAGKHSAEQVDNALREMQLLSDCDKDARQLSAGQKQLLCLARVLLRDCQILVCDEATGSIDPKTEDFVQRVLTERLGTKTILTIAHRLKTILHCDQVLVLDNGRCVERGAPQELAAQNSHFSQLLHASQAS